MTHIKISSIEMSKDVLVLNQAGMDCPIPDVYDEYKFINPSFPEDGDKDAAKIQSAIDSAVAAERERCAKIAEEVGMERDYNDSKPYQTRVWKEACAEISKRISEGA